MSTAWVEIDSWDDEAIRYVADRNNPDQGCLVVVCTPSMRTPRALARGVLAALEKQVTATNAMPKTSHCWGLVERWVGVWKISRLVLVGAHRLTSALVDEASGFAARASLELRFVATGAVKSNLRAALDAGAVRMQRSELFDELGEIPIDCLDPLQHPDELPSDAGIVFDESRRRAGWLLPALPASRDHWFQELPADQATALTCLLDEIFCSRATGYDVVVRGLLSGMALQGWRWPTQDDTIGAYVRVAGLEPWSVLNRYRQPSSASAVVFASLGLSPAEALAVGPRDVAQDGGWVELTGGTISVAAPAARRSLAAQAAANREMGMLPEQFLIAHGQALSLGTTVDIVRRSVGILGADLVT